MLDERSSARMAEELQALPFLAEDSVTVCTPEGVSPDQWPAGFKQAFAAPVLPAVVVEATSTEAVSGLLAWATAAGLTVRIEGLSSNVVGATRGKTDLVLSTRRLDGRPALDEVSGIVTAGAGTRGSTLEAWLRERGFTLGQYPQSLYISTVGGWAATRATGSHSALYGGIETAICGATVVLGSGEVLNFEPRVRPAGGIDGIGLMVGSEGSLGVITEVSLVVHRTREDRRLCAMFDSLRAGLEAQRLLVQQGYPIGLARLYNAAETAAICPDERDGRCLLILTTRSPGELEAAHHDALRTAVTTWAGSVTESSVADAWFSNRYLVDRLMEGGNSAPGEMFDTIEVSLPWSTAAACAEALEAAMPALSRPFYQHFSHVYPAGVCLYMMLYLQASDEPAVLELWREAWGTARDIVHSHRGAFGHHHGVGAVRSSEYQATADGRLHELIKSSVDPSGTLAARLLVGESVTAR